MTHTKLFTAIALITVVGCAGDRIEQQQPVDTTEPAIEVSQATKPNESPVRREGENLAATVDAIKTRDDRSTAAQGAISTPAAEIRIAKQVGRDRAGMASMAEMSAMIAPAPGDYYSPPLWQGQDRDKYQHLDEIGRAHV